MSSVVNENGESRISEVDLSTVDASNVIDDDEAIQHIQQHHHANNHQFCLPYYDVDSTIPTHELYLRLKEIDMSSAMAIHPKDRRKILRYIHYHCFCLFCNVM